MKTDLFQSCGTAEFSRFAGILRITQMESGTEDMVEIKLTSRDTLRPLTSNLEF